MRSLNLIFTLFFLLIPAISAYDGYVKLSGNAADKEWDFLPSIPDSFDSSSQTTIEAFLLIDQYGFLASKSEFKLDAIRSNEPKKVNLTADKQKYEFLYLLNASSALTFAYKKQSADRQFFDCYSFNSLVIGSCEDSDLILSNSSDRYKDLNQSLLYIDGENEALELNYRVALNNFFIDELSVGLEFTEMQYFWLTPLDGITSNFILNIKIEGQKLGDIINRELARLPQQSSWSSKQINLSFAKTWPITQSFNLFYELSGLYIEQDGYISTGSIPETNFMLTSGIKYSVDRFEIAILGSFYKNNLLGFEPITVNQRTENYFNRNFGTLGLEVTYFF